MESSSETSGKPRQHNQVPSSSDAEVNNEVDTISRVRYRVDDWSGRAPRQVDVQPPYSELHPVPVGSTITRLRRRIEARFPESGLSRVTAELVQLAEANEEAMRQLRRPLWWLRGLK